MTGPQKHIHPNTKRHLSFGIWMSIGIEKSTGMMRKQYGIWDYDTVKMVRFDEKNHGFSPQQRPSLGHHRSIGSTARPVEGPWGAIDHSLPATLMLPARTEGWMDEDGWM